MNKVPLMLILLGWLVIKPVAVQAQFLKVPQGGVHAVIDQLLAESASFTATAEMRLVAPDGKETTSGVIEMAGASGNIRAENDLQKTEPGQLPPLLIENYKKRKMDRWISITQLKKKLIYVVFPGLKGYVEMPLETEPATPSSAPFKLEKTGQGTETVDGHPCVKNKISATGKQGVRLEGFTWNATDLKNFPVKIQLAESGNIVLMQFTNIRLGDPPPSQFEPPPDYAKFKDQQELLAAGHAAFKAGTASAPPRSTNTLK